MPSNDDVMTKTAVWPAELKLEKQLAQVLPAFLMRQRWYPVKDAGLPAVELALWTPLTLPDVAAALAVWQVRPSGFAPLQLFVPVALLPAQALPADDSRIITKLADGRLIADAFADDAFVQAWIALMLGRQPFGLPPALQAGQTPLLEQSQLLAGGTWQIRRSKVEQSNTSIRVGEDGIVKVIRKLEEGVHPELEMSRFLSEVNYPATPPLLAWLEINGATVSILQAFVPNAGDGWTWLLKHLQPDGLERLDDSLPWIRQLGVRTAQMHKALALHSTDPDFMPEPIDAADLQRWLADVEAMSQRALTGIGRSQDQLDPATRTLAQRLQQQADQLRVQAQALLTAAQGLAKTRHHGDYHLGQVLVSDTDAMIIDFEGEPLRPLAERRAKHSPLRDVAGMLRSFAYAAAAAERALPADWPAERRAWACARLQDWECKAEQTYLEAYLAIAKGTPICPADEAQALRLIHFFMLEKALYEVAYELANRPDWLAIPLRGVLALLGEAPASGGSASGDAADRRQTRRHLLPHGAEPTAQGVRFRLWAPGCQAVELVLEGGATLAMSAGEEGWFELTTDQARAGTRYRYRLPDGLQVPDPASRFQPEDVHGPSEVIDPTAYAWQDGDWRGRPWHEAVVYELHVGTFTAAGTFRAAIERLDHLVALGVTAIEIMPIADFPGARNWGYDGVLPYAPDSSYGRPEDLKALIEAAHARGLMVLLDVVYNHFGPDGNYLPVYAPQFFTERHQTPWGAAINYDGEHSRPVREFVIHNALYWLQEFHLDGLRLDAVHAIIDDSPKHLLDELAERVRAQITERPVHLLLENEENEAHRLRRDAQSQPQHYTAQWNDDVHHVLHVAATGEDKGYYADYLGDTDKLGRALAEGFAFQGEMMPYRGEARGEPSAELPPGAFVAFIQNHDQIGNRAFGERIGAIAPPQAVRAITAVYLLLPQVPMLFMGEEWNAAQPFLFFCDFHGELAEAVRKGRREEFAKFPEFQDEKLRARIPDPQAQTTFEASKLDWSALDQEPHAQWLAWHRQLLTVRREQIVPVLPRITHGGIYRVVAPGAVVVSWRLQQGGELTLAANLSERPVSGFPRLTGTPIWQEGQAGAGDTLAAWSVHWSLQS